jgi:hypothetical protein
MQYHRHTHSLPAVDWHIAYGSAGIAERTKQPGTWSQTLHKPSIDGRSKRRG